MGLRNSEVRLALFVYGRRGQRSAGPIDDDDARLEKLDPQTRSREPHAHLYIPRAMSRRDIQRTSRIPLVVNFKVAVSSLPSIFIAKFSAPGKSRCDQLAQATLYNREVNGTRRRSEGRKKGEGDNGVKERKKERDRGGTEGEKGIEDRKGG